VSKVIRYYWVDQLELTDKATHTEPYCGPNGEAAIVVNSSVIEEIHRIAEAWGTIGCHDALKKIYEMTQATDSAKGGDTREVSHPATRQVGSSQLHDTEIASSSSDAGESK
jgi:hypothetical protein